MKHQFSTFAGNIKDSEVKGTTDLIGLINDISNPDDFTQCLIDEIRSENDEDKRSKLKWMLKGYTPSVLLNERRKLDNVISYSGLMPLDFDKLESLEYAQEFKQYLFEQYPFIYASWLSSSGKGVRALVHIPVCESIDDYRQYFNGLAHEHMMGYTGFDKAPKNAVLPLFQSHDPDLLYRESAYIWSNKYTPPEPPPKQKIPIIGNDKNRISVQRLTQSAIDKIKDNGHPQLRGASFALGGYVGAGYIDEYDAIDMMDSMIESNNYLSTKHKVYKQTARDMIKSGQNKPLYL
jgi:hypothetical protein